eukprot:6196763-Pleurochrysis_carterae.AAC.1
MPEQPLGSTAETVATLRKARPARVVQMTLPPLQSMCEGGACSPGRRCDHHHRHHHQYRRRRRRHLWRRCAHLSEQTARIRPVWPKQARSSKDWIWPVECEARRTRKRRSH